jgi:hypothetical protein
MTLSLFVFGTGSALADSDEESGQTLNEED